jgi:hypothetical protein
MVNPLSVSADGCIVCCHPIEEHPTSIAEYPVGHQSEQGIEINHLLHLGCVLHITSQARILECPCCGGEIARERQYMLAHADQLPEMGAIQITLVTGEQWREVRQEEQQKNSISSQVHMRLLFAAIVLGDRESIALAIQLEEELFEMTNQFALALLSTAILWGQLDSLTELLKDSRLAEKIPASTIIDLSIQAAQQQKRAIAHALYDRLSVSPPEQFKPKLRDILHIMRAAETGFLPPIKEAMGLPYFYDAALGNVSGQVFLRAAKHSQVNLVNLLLKSGSQPPLEYLTQACILASENGNRAMLKELLTIGGRELQYLDRIKILASFGSTETIPPLFLLDENPPPDETIAPAAFLIALNGMFPAPLKLVMVIAHMETFPEGRVAFNGWIEELCHKIKNSDSKTFKFFDYLLSINVGMTAVCAGGLARAVVGGARQLKGKTLPLLEKLFYWAAYRILAEDKWAMLLSAIENGGEDIVQFIITTRPPLILTPAKQSILHSVSASPEIAALLRRAYPPPVVTNRFREYPRRGWEWVCSLPRRLWQKFCSCFR